MFRMTIATEDKAAVLAALKKGRVEFSLVSCVTVDRGARAPGRAEAIYKLAKEGLAYQDIADRTGVSYATVVRVVQNPAHYGLRGEPIRRIPRRL